MVDICTFDDAEIVEDLYLERLRDGKPLAEPHLERFRISPGTGTVATERLIDEPMELPRINYGRCNERPVPLRLGRRHRRHQLARPDRQGRRHRARPAVWHEEGCFPGEPVFVAAPGRARPRTPGVLLSVVLDGRRGNSFLLVLDAARSTSWRGRRSRTTSRSASTGSSPRA